MAPEPQPTASVKSATGLDLTGRTLGEFQIIRRIGKGGMAEVYLAEQTTLKRQVAIKVLRAEFLSDATYVKRFRHEATAAGGLNHPNIVQVYSIGEQEGIHFIAQEYVRGGNLKEFLKRKGPLEWNVAIFLMKQVAAALQVAGTSGIVHRDIKPENILLTKKGEAKVADFGLAQLTQGGERVAMTQVGVTMGTPLYMSPEQVGGKPLDHRSDIYSFGAMAYHMLAGRPPFKGENALAVAVQHLNEKPEPLKNIRPDLPQAVCDLVHKMMAKQREDRFADAQALLNELKSLQKQLTSKDGTPLPVNNGKPARPSRSLATASWATRSLRRQVLALIGAGVVVGGVAAGVGWTQRVRDPFLVPPPTRDAHEVPRQSSISAQYFYAMLHGENDEAAWRAVVDYPPNSQGETNEMDRKIAAVRLAIVYVRQDRLADAEAIFEKLARSGDSWQVNQGTAGLAILQSARGHVGQSDLTMTRLPANAELVGDLKDLLIEARERNKRQAN